MRGRVIFDYASANGICPIGAGRALFETKWTRAGGDTIYAYNDPASIDAIALASGIAEFSEIRDAERFDYSSRARHPREGQILLLRNVGGLYAALKIRDVKAVGYEDTVDWVTFDFVILEDGSRDFSGITDMQVADASFTKRVLLIGAGFSKNWGGLLASEVSGAIMAHAAVRARPPLLREWLLRESFEDVLEETRAGRFEAADAQAMEAAIGAAFEGMDVDFRNPNPRVYGPTVNDFIARFCPGPVGIGTGYVFTLNQDLLLERTYGTRVDRQQFAIPGVTWRDPPPPFPAGLQPIPLASLIDPTAVGEPPLLRNFNHIKLHGSINWRSSDGSSSMVMGRRKPLTISRTPLLEWYHRVFESVLSSGDVRLMVVGYGWGDEHINEPIAEAVRNRGLQVYSWNPAHPRDMLAGKHKGDAILAGVMGFTIRPMTEVMPNDPMNPGSAHYDGIVRDFF